MIVILSQLTQRFGEHTSRQQETNLNDEDDATSDQDSMVFKGVSAFNE